MYIHFCAGLKMDFANQDQHCIRDTGKKLEPRQLWNCDESGSTSDPARSKVISTKFEVVYKITWGAGR